MNLQFNYTKKQGQLQEVSFVDKTHWFHIAPKFITASIWNLCSGEAIRLGVLDA